jgi:hypothetical protein
VTFFSGFSFCNEYDLFQDILQSDDFSLAGFSYGAIKAFEKAYKDVSKGKRVDKLQLISPAFFQTKSEKYRLLQLTSFESSPKKYLDKFLSNVNMYSDKDISQYIEVGSYSELEELLNYTWDESKLEYLIGSGVDIEVYMGEKDKIVDIKQAKEFFVEFATTYLLKEKGHCL